MKILSVKHDAANRSQKRRYMKELKSHLSDYLSIKAWFYDMLFSSEFTGDYDWLYQQTLEIVRRMTENKAMRKEFVFTEPHPYWFATYFKPLEKPYNRTFVSIQRIRDRYYGEGLRNKVGGSF